MPFRLYPFSLALFFVLLVCQAVLAQPSEDAPVLPKVEHISVKDGLPHREMTAIVQDRQGLFWLSSRMGVVRYDGYQFAPLRNIAQNGYLVPPALTRIFVQPNGDLLFITNENSFFNYDRQRNEVSVHPIHQAVGHSVLPMQYGLVVFENDHDFLLEMQENGKRFLLRWSPQSGLTKLDSTAHRTVDLPSLLKDQAGNIFWGTREGGIRRYGPDGKFVEKLMLPFTNFDENNPAWSSDCFFNAKGQLLVRDFSKMKVMRWDWEQHQTTAVDFPFDVNHYNVLTDEAGNTWFFGIKKLWLLDPQDHLHDLLPFLVEKADFSVIRMLCLDAQQQCWVTSDNGIFRLGASGSQFARYLSDPQPKWAKTTRGFFEDNDGTKYFRCESCGEAADNTIFSINESTGTADPHPFTSTDFPPEGIFSWTKYFYKMPDQEVVWTLGKNGIIRMDLDARTVRIVPTVNPRFINNASAQVGWGVSRKGEILAGGRLSQLLAFDPATEKMRPLLSKGIEREQDGLIRTIIEAADGTLWVGLNRGLYQVGPAQGKILQHFTSETHPAFFTDEIQALYEDKDGTIWAGTFGGGLVHVFPKTGEAFSFTTTDGLPDNIIAAILPWQEDYLWVSTFNGLTCFNKKEKTFVNFYEEDGLSHNEFNLSSAFIDGKGRYYFGGMNGLNSFYPEEVMKPRSKPLSLLLTGYSFFDEKTDTLAEQFGGLQGLGEVTFSPYVSWFQFNYALPDYVNPRLNQFKTWLEGFEKDWTYQGVMPFIRYNRLPAGHYTLHIKAADAKGYWSEDELLLKITVQQVFYKTWWFILLGCIVVGAAGFALLRYRYQQRLALEQMRTRIASDLHDEVGSSLSHLNFLVGSFDLENSPGVTAKAIEKSKEIMQKTASDIRDVVWAIDARRDKTGDLLDRMEDFAFDLFSTRNIAYHFMTEGILRESVLNPFVRQNIYLIFKEAVNNIAKHSNASVVKIVLTQKGEMLEMRVADNGKAVNSSKVKGQGLENMALRAKRIGGEVEIAQREEGFVVVLRVPM